MIRMAQRALTLVRPVEGSTTGPDRPTTWTRRSSSARSSGSSQEAVASETSMPYLINHTRLVGHCKTGVNVKPRSAFDGSFESSFGHFYWCIFRVMNFQRPLLFSGTVQHGADVHSGSEGRQQRDVR